jgi:hypothetical protein
VPLIFLVSFVTAAIFTLPALRSGPLFNHHYRVDPSPIALPVGIPPEPVPRINVIVQVTINSLASLTQALPPAAISQSGNVWTLKQPVMFTDGASLDVRGPGTLRLAPGSYLAVGPGGSARLTDLSIASTAPGGSPAARQSERRDRGFLLATGGQLVLDHDDVSDLGRLAGLADGIAFAGAAAGSAVRDSVVSGNLVGVYATATAGLTITGNRIVDSETDGIEMHGQVSTTTVANNFIAKSGEHDVVLAGHVVGVLVSGNEIDTASQDGLLLYNGAHNDIIRGNGFYGSLDAIVLTVASGDTVQGNVVGSALRFALRINGASTGDLVSNNQFDDAAIGAYLLEGAHGNRLLANTFSSDGENVRIRLTAPGNIVNPAPSASELRSV